MSSFSSSNTLKSFFLGLLLIWSSGLSGYCKGSPLGSGPKTGRLMNQSHCLKWGLVDWEGEKNQGRRRSVVPFIRRLEAKKNLRKRHLLLHEGSRLETMTDIMCTWDLIQTHQCLASLFTTSKNPWSYQDCAAWFTYLSPCEANLLAPALIHKAQFPRPAGAPHLTTLVPFLMTCMSTMQPPMT